MRNDAKAKFFSRKIAKRSEKSFFFAKGFFFIMRKIAKLLRIRNHKKLRKRKLSKNCEEKAKRSRILFLSEFVIFRKFFAIVRIRNANLKPCSKWLIHFTKQFPPRPSLSVLNRGGGRVQVMARSFDDHPDVFIVFLSFVFCLRANTFATRDNEPRFLINLENFKQT